MIVILMIVQNIIPIEIINIFILFKSHLNFLNGAALWEASTCEKSIYIAVAPNVYHIGRTDTT